MLSNVVKTYLCSNLRPHLGSFISQEKDPNEDWRDGRVVYGARLESVFTETYPGFESLSLRDVVR